MNNTELMSFFQELESESNCFNLIENLKKANKQYKKSSFFKHTKMPIGKAYNLFQTQGILKLCRFINSPLVQTMLQGDTFLLRTQLQEFLLGFDTTCLEPIFVALEDRLNNMVVTDNLNMVEELQNTVKGFLQSIQK